MTQNSHDDPKGQVSLAQSTSWHPEPMLLANYLDGTLAVETADQIRLHLHACDLCRSEIAQMEAPPPFEVLASEPPVKYTSFQDMVDEAKRKDAKLNSPPATSFSESKPSGKRPFVWLERLALAASLVLAAWLWLAPERPAAHGDPLEIQLLPKRQTRQGADAISMRAGRLVLQLVFTDATSAHAFEASVIFKRDKKLRWRSAIKRQSNGMFVLVFDAGFFEPAGYEISLLGDGQILATYAFEIEGE